MKIKKLKENSGAAAVEFALILPVLVIILFGIVQFGIAFNNWITLTHAAREGARLAAVGQYENEGDLKEKIIQRAANIGLGSGDITITGLDGNIGDVVTVTCNKNFNFLSFITDLPFVLNYSNANIQLSSNASMRIENTQNG